MEQKRGCGWRRVGGIYLMADVIGTPCDRLPFALTVCPTCSCGIKQARGWTWVDVQALTQGPHDDCEESQPCVFCEAEIVKAGLLWVGGRFYKTTGIFMQEAHLMGVSRRLSTIPRGLKIGETWVLLAHPEALPPLESDGPNGKRRPGVFCVVRPNRLEIIVTESQSKDEAYMASLAERKLVPVIVADDDKKHQGSVWDDEPEPEATPEPETVEV